MTSTTALPVEIQLTLPQRPAYEGDWVPLLLVVTRPSDAEAPGRIANVTCTDPDVQLDLDLLDRELDLFPGETYRLTIPIRARRPKVVGLGHIQLWIRQQDATLDEPVRIPALALQVRHGIGKHIAMTLEPLCLYAQGTKVLLSLEHTGATALQDVTINLHPHEQIVSGKNTLQKSLFASAETLPVEFVFSGKEIEVELTATVDGQRAETRRSLSVGPPRAIENRFRFLEPKRLSIDQTALAEKTSDGSSPVEPRQGVYALCGGNQYELTIRPQHPSVTRLEVRDIPNLIHVRNKVQLADGSWKFALDVGFNELMSKPEVIYYEVETASEKLTGEIAICLEPTRLRHLRMAAALGVALTVQGVAALGRFLHNADYDLTSVASEFNFRDDFHVLFVLCIPVFWGLVTLVDWAQYRWRQ